LGISNDMYKMLCKKILFFWLLASAFIGGLKAQVSDPSDSLTAKQSFTRAYNNRVVEHLKEYERSRTVSEQRRRLNELKHFEERLDYFLVYGLDTNQLFYQIQFAEYGKVTALEGLLNPTAIFYSSRDLASSQNALKEILRTLEGIKFTLGKRLKEIEKYQTEFDSLVSDSNLFLIQTHRIEYQNVLTDYLLTNERLMRNFATLLEVNEQLQKLLTRVNFLSDQLEFSISEITQRRYALSDRLLDREQAYIWETTYQGRSFKEVVARAYKKERDLLNYTYQNNRFSLFFMVVLALIIGYFIRRISRAILKDGNLEIFNLNPVFKYPIFSALFFTIIIGQFVFFSAPFVLQGFLWLGSWAIALWFIANNIAPFNNSQRYLFFLLLYPFIFFENLLLEPYPYEQWFILITCLLIVGLGIYDWTRRGKVLPERLLYRIVLIFFLSVEWAAALAIVLGRYNLGKALMISGYFGMMAALILFWTKSIWFHALQIPISGLENRVQRRIYTNLEQLSSNSDVFINILLYIAIAVSFFRHFFLYNVVVEYITTQVGMIRYIGKYAYSWESVLTFIGILMVTVFITRIIALFFDDKLFDATGTGKRGGVKNLGIVFKLIILSIGFVIAFAAAGVSMDKLTIIIGSFGLGIGFGLQNIVSHMISGVIIAFEQPFVVNDQVEWNGVLGRISQIGLRSSKIENVDGSEVVVPNTDLLNQRLLNWTHNSSLRRVELIIGLNYQSDLNKAKHIIEESVSQIELVRKFPEPQVLMHVFADNAVECRLLFWVDINDMLQAKSEVILHIHKSFADNGITIPYPQLDVHMDPK